MRESGQRGNDGLLEAKRDSVNVTPSSKVTVTVRSREIGKTGNKLRSFRRKKLKKPSKTLFEKIFHNLKKFARVTLSTKGRKKESHSSFDAASDQTITGNHKANTVNAKDNTIVTKVVSDITFGENFNDRKHSLSRNKGKDENESVSSDFQQNAQNTKIEEDNAIDEKTLRHFDQLGSRGKGRSLPFDSWPGETENVERVLKYKPSRFEKVREINFFSEFSVAKEGSDTSIRSSDDSQFKIVEFTHIFLIAVGISVVFLFTSCEILHPLHLLLTYVSSYFRLTDSSGVAYKAELIFQEARPFRHLRQPIGYDNQHNQYWSNMD